MATVSHTGSGGVVAGGEAIVYSFTPVSFITRPDADIAVGDFSSTESSLYNALNDEPLSSGKYISAIPGAATVVACTISLQDKAWVQANTGVRMILEVDKIGAERIDVLVILRSGDAAVMMRVITDVATAPIQPVVLVLTDEECAVLLGYSDMRVELRAYEVAAGSLLLTDFNGDPLYDSAGNPMYSDPGNTDQLRDSNDVPLYDANDSPLYSND